MKTLLFWLLLILAGAYGWGWVKLVHSGEMRQSSYNAYCIRLTKEFYENAFSTTSGWIEKFSKPVHRPEAVLE